MKALVLAGGAGTRLRPITHTSAKQLVPVANKPVLFYGLEAIRDAGITDVGIIVGDTAREVEAAIGDGTELGIKATYIPQDAPKGLAHAVLIAKDFLGDEPFVMYLGDNFLLGGITKLVAEFAQSEAAAQILLTKVSNPQSFGIAVVDDKGDVVKLVEKPKDPPSDLALVGVYMFRTPIHEAVRSIKPSARGELEITDAIQWLVDNKHSVKPHLVTGYWKDTGKLEDMLECNRAVLETMEAKNEGTVDSESKLIGRVMVEKGAVITRSIIRGPAIIGKNTKVTDTYVGPFTSIYHECELSDTEIEHSIVLENTIISSVARIEDSLIGKEVEVRGSNEQPKANRFMLGDHSRVIVNQGN
jgi:glucose-1-phosphate thymidylyltransferase